MTDEPVAVTLRFMREVNTMALLACLRQHDQVSVAHLADATGISRQAVTRALRELRTNGLVDYLPPARSERRVGRPAQTVRLRATAGFVLGGVIDPLFIQLAVADLRGHVVASTRANISPSVEPGGVATLLVQETAALLTRAEIRVSDVWHAAIGAPGIVDPSTGVISLAPSMPSVVGDVVHTAISDYLLCPVTLDNDLNLATRGEQWKGAGSSEDNLVVVHWGQRVGAGIVANGSLYRGVSNDAGDLGFLDICAADSAPVQGLGLFESWVGTHALVRLAARYDQTKGPADPDKLLHHTENLNVILQGIHDGYGPHMAAMKTLVKRFAYGIAAIRALLDPQVVVLAGPVAEIGAPLLDALGRELSAFVLAPPSLQLSTLKEKAAVFGALRTSLDVVERGGYGASIVRRDTGETGPDEASLGVPTMDPFEQVGEER